MHAYMSISFRFLKFVQKKQKIKLHGTHTNNKQSTFPSLSFSNVQLVNYSDYELSFALIYFHKHVHIVFMLLYYSI